MRVLGTILAVLFSSTVFAANVQAETYTFNGSVNLSNLRPEVESARVKCALYTGTYSNQVRTGQSSPVSGLGTSRSFDYQVQLNHNGFVRTWRCWLEVRAAGGSWLQPSNEQTNGAYQYENSGTVRSRQGEF